MTRVDANAEMAREDAQPESPSETCESCERTITRKYCRDCDVHFWDGHSRDCIHARIARQCREQTHDSHDSS